ncbi:hypothetical protein [Salinarimonas ramus]|uniref:Uncharacterized protein n=1 Tax=Salinarimonas ramus TaxID=690164 RepID=A0A917QAM1_9HYPH|nr:hypothetical protein [Salinarimonas ramus]GGK39475.1 hypothetical protein GCM10011322_28270 [Salinarimonas ramus]
MMLFDKARQNELAIRRMGVKAVAEARKAGVAAYYVEPAFGDGIVKEMPDGTRHLIEAANGTDVVIRSIAPRS